MANSNSYKKGDKIIEYGQVYSIVDITERDSFNGNGTETIIHFAHFYKNRENKTMQYSIPVANIHQTYIRKPLTKLEVSQLLNEWVKMPNIKTPSDKSEVTEMLNKNDPKDTVRLLKCLWIEKEDESTNYTKSKRDMFSLAMDRFVEEVAFVLGISIEEAENQIVKALKKHSEGESVVEETAN